MESIYWFHGQGICTWHEDKIRHGQNISQKNYTKCNNYTLSCVQICPYQACTSCIDSLGNTSNQSYFTTSKRSRPSNNTGRGHYNMYVQNLIVYNFAFKHFNFWLSAFYSSTLQKTKAVQRMFVLKCSQNYAIYFWHTVLCTYKTMYKCKKHSPIQNYRHAMTRKCEIRMKLHLGHNRNRLEGSQCEF